MLSPYRVLDLTNERGLLAGQMLADLGADVIQVEPPGGSSARRLGPYYHDEEGPEKSLYWWAYARNKRGITCDLEAADGQALLKRLAENADFVIESEMPGVMASRGLGYQDLAAINPRLVYVSITPFGQDGPKAHYADCDLILVAAGGPLFLAGDPDRAPVRVSVPQAYHHASADAAGAALIAHRERQRSKQGQHVDVSAQQSVAQATMAAVLAKPLGDAETVRSSGGLVFGGLRIRFIWPAKDGHVSITHLFGTAIGPFTRRLMEWIYEEGGCDEATRDKDWLAYAQLLLSGEEPVAEFERVKQVIAAFTSTKTKAELFEAAQQRGLLIVPITTLQEVSESPQLADRGYWRDLKHPEVNDTVRYPGPFVRYSNQPMADGRRAPLIGEHNAEVYGELGLSDGELAELRTKGVL
ncbi:MAG: CoA transferase [Dehalococcoidia bacterium]